MNVLILKTFKSTKYVNFQCENFVLLSSRAWNRDTVIKKRQYKQLDINVVPFILF